MSKLAQLREARGLSRKDVAQLLGRQIKDVVGFEKGVQRLAPQEVQILTRKYSLPDKYFDDLEDRVPGDLDQIVGRNIKYYRELNGLTQKILAEELGYSAASSISGVERGIKPIGKKALVRLSEIFGIHVSELFNPTDLSVISSKDKIISDFMLVVQSDPKPSNWDALAGMITEAKEEITSQG
jgi:transcriptional regulator with XRE-family HTH domain